MPGFPDGLQGSSDDPGIFVNISRQKPRGPSKSAGYVAGIIATFFIPGGGEEAAAGDAAKLAELGDDAGELADLAKANGN
jgi:hypothetical protein